MNLDQLQEMFNCSLSDLQKALEATGNGAFKNSNSIPDDVVIELDNHFKKPAKKALSGHTPQPKQAPIQETKPSDFEPSQSTDTLIADPVLRTMYDAVYQEGYTQELMLQQVRYQGTLDARQTANQQRLIAELNRSRQATQELSNALIALIDNSTEVQQATLEVMGKEVMSYQETMRQLTPTLNF